MGGGASQFFDDVAGAFGDIIDDTVSTANMIGGYIEDGFDTMVSYAEDITKLGGMLLADSLNAAISAGKKYFNALVREARRKAALIENSAKQAAQVAQDTFNDTVGEIENAAKTAGNAIENQAKNIGNAVESTANDFSKEMENTANTIKDGIEDTANVATTELEGVVDDTVSIAEDGLNFLVSQDWFDMKWAQDFMNTLFQQFDRLTNIKFVSKSKKKPTKKELEEQDPNDPSKTSKIVGYKEEPQLIDENGKLSFNMVNEDQLKDFENIQLEKFVNLKKNFNRKKIFILILLFVLILLLILNSTDN